MKMDFFTHEFFPFRGGVAVFVEECARAMAAGGREVRVLTPGEGLATQNLRGLQVQRYRAGTRLSPAALLSHARFLDANRQELSGRTLVLSSVGAWMGALLLEMWKPLEAGELVGLFHGSEILKFQANPFWHRPARNLMARADRLVAVSEFSRGLLRNPLGGFGEFSERTLVCACACRTDLAPSPAALEGRKRGDTLRLLCLARIDRRKNQLDLVKAIATLNPPQRKRLTLILAGSGDPAYLAEIRKLALASGANLETPGRVPDAALPDLHASADVAVLASRSLPRSVEGFGMSLLEANHCGLPVLAYAAGGIPEAVHHRHSAWLVPEGDVPALAEGMRLFLEEPGFREGLAAKARAHAAEFSWDKVAAVLSGTSIK